MERFGKIVGTGDDTPLAYDDGSNGYLAFGQCLPGLLYGLRHKQFVLLLLFFCTHHFFSDYPTKWADLPYPLSDKLHAETHGGTTEWNKLKEGGHH